MPAGHQHIVVDGEALCGEIEAESAYLPNGSPIARVLCGDCVSIAQAAGQRGVRPVPQQKGRGNGLLRRDQWLLSDAPTSSIDISIILGTVNRPEMLKRCIDAIRKSVDASRLIYEIVVAIGRHDEPAIPWLEAQNDARIVDGGMTGAINAFNIAYQATRGLLIGQVNDDVIVEGSSIAIAARHLYEDPDCAGVVFRFRRGNEVGYRNEYLTDGKVHPNQIIARRSTCEAVIEKIGAFWGDEAHRTDKTYGGDSAFGVICHNLGLKLSVLENVTCYDLEHDDALRLSNQPPLSHGDRWRAMYRPLLESRSYPAPINLEARAERIAALDPVEGRLPPTAEPQRERVLHLHLSTPDDPQAALVRMLRSFGDYAQVDWPTRNREIAGPTLDIANWMRPTLVFMQLQTPGVVDPSLIARLRPLMAPSGVIATWCGDVAGANSPWTVDWQIPLGRAIDLTLHSSYTHVKALRAAGVKNAAYLQIGYDEEQYRPVAAEKSHDIVFLGNRYYSPQYLQSMQAHDADLRDRVIVAMANAFGARFGLFGSGHAFGLGLIPLSDAHVAYQRAKIGLNISLCNFFEAYSSDRIFRILGCGALLLTKRFPLMSVYGLESGVNCLAWDTPEEAVSIAKHILLEEHNAERERIAQNGQTLALQEHTWAARKKELAAYLKAVRG